MKFFEGKVLEAVFSTRTPKNPSGASRATLMRRLRYGGRKGRSAARRLHELDAPLRQMRAYFSRQYGMSP